MASWTSLSFIFYILQAELLASSTTKRCQSFAGGALPFVQRLPLEPLVYEAPGGGTFLFVLSGVNVFVIGCL